MKTKYGRKTMCMVLITMMVIGLFAVTSITVKAEPVSSPVFRVNDDPELLAEADSGTGVWDDPFIIENRWVDGVGENYAMYIGNTTAYLIIRNNIVNGTDQVHQFPYSISAGIHLYNVDNVQIINCTIYDIQTYGIAITNDSYNVSVEDCTIWNFERGISIDDTDSGVFDNNKIYGNSTGNFGLVFNTLSDGHIIRNNIIEDCNWFGIAYNDSWNVVMENNTIKGTDKDSSFCGIGAYNSKYMELRNNSISDTDFGILLYNTTTSPLRESQIDLYNNIITDCYEGILLNEVYEIGVYGGFIETENYGIKIIECDDVFINDIEFVNMETGIEMNQTVNVTISECTFIDLSLIAITIDDGLITSLSQLIITNIPTGIDATSVEALEIIHSDLTNVETCMAISIGLGIDIVNNTFVNNTMVIIMVDSDIVNVVDNTFTNNTGGAIGMNQCSDVTITSNNFTDSGETLGAITLDTVINVTMTDNDFVSAEFRHVTFDTVTNAESYGNYFYTAEYGDAWDDGNNTWNHSTLGGNYWCNYTGEDADGDGFGDTPYNISGGTNQDFMPIVYTLPTIFETLMATLVALLFQLMLPLIVIMVVIGMLGGILNPKKGKKSKK